jgi:hypothetical protein
MRKRKFLSVNDVKAALLHLAQDIVRESKEATKDSVEPSAVWHDTLFITINNHGKKLYAGQLLFVTPDMEKGKAMHQEMMDYLHFQGNVLGQGEVVKTFYARKTEVK